MPVLTGPEPVARPFIASGATLCSWHFEQADDGGKPWLVMLHGMRDVSRGLLPVAWPLVDRFRIVLFDLRGHGDSEYTGSYSVNQYYFDLLTLLTQLKAEDATVPLYLFGHSLGGQLAARAAGLFPELIDALVLAEGLGPPRPGWPDAQPSEAEEVAMLREQLRTRFAQPARLRPLPSLDFAKERLLANNPRLVPAQAALTARYGTRLEETGERHWAFDPRVTSVFVGFRDIDSARLWRQATCPVLSITGDLAGEYWSAMHPTLADYDGSFQTGEYEERLRAFQTVTHLRFEGSGHMVHFDEPDRLAETIDEFLRR